MQTDELLNLLRDAGMQDEDIKALLSDAIASLEGSAENQQPDAPVDDEKRMQEVFGA